MLKTREDFMFQHEKHNKFDNFNIIFVITFNILTKDQGLCNSLTGIYVCVCVCDKHKNKIYKTYWN